MLAQANSLIILEELWACTFSLIVQCEIVLADVQTCFHHLTNMVTLYGASLCIIKSLVSGVCCVLLGGSNGVLNLGKCLVINF